MGKTKDPGTVYAICVKGQWGRYKIGRAKDPAARLASLQTGHPDELVLLRQYRTPNMQRDEKRMHRILGRYQIRGEWFECKIAVVDLAWRQVSALRGPLSDDACGDDVLSELVDDYGSR